MFYLDKYVPYSDEYTFYSDEYASYSGYLGLVRARGQVGSDGTRRSRPVLVSGSGVWVGFSKKSAYAVARRMRMRRLAAPTFAGRATSLLSFRPARAWRLPEYA